MPRPGRRSVGRYGFVVALAMSAVGLGIFSTTRHLLDNAVAVEAPSALIAHPRNPAQSHEIPTYSPTAGSAKSHECTDRCCWIFEPPTGDDGGMFTTLGTYTETLVSPTMFLELSDVVYGWMSELTWWCVEKGNQNAEFEADSHVDRNTNFGMALGCMQPGIVVFVETWVLAKWFARPIFARSQGVSDASRFFGRFDTMHTQMKVPYVLVTGHSDKPCPGDYAKYLDDPMLLRWYGNNPTQAHPNFTPIPIGLNGFYHSHAILSIRSRGLHTKPKTHLAVANFFLASHEERRRVWSMLCDGLRTDWLSCLEKGGAWYPAGAALTEQVEALLPYKFWISPRGNGLDCHRTWEALYMGSIPVVRSSFMDSLYEGLPVLIVNEWTEVTKATLDVAYDQLAPNGVLMIDESKLHKAYWRRHFDEHKKHPGQRLNITARSP
jgi:hypothetical protein